MKIEKTNLKVVQISTGSVLSPSHVGTFTPFMHTKESHAFYIGGLTKKRSAPRERGEVFLGV